MTSNISRRDWFRSTIALTAGFSMTSSLTAQLMAAPASEAEKYFFDKEKKTTGKIRLNSNENPYGPSDKARQAVIDILSEANRYPFQAIEGLKAVLAAREGVPVEYIHVGAGSGDMLSQTGAAFGLEGGRVMSSWPTFPMLMSYAEVFKATWDKVNLNDKLEYDYDAMASAVTNETKLIFICNPNNPTGTFVDPAKVRAFCESVSPRVPIFSDEAYLEFMEPAQQVSMVELVKKDMNVIVSRTFSKIYGLAGLRVGYIIAKPDLIKKISKYNSGIPMNQAAIAAAHVSLGDQAFMKMTREKNAAARKVLTDYLDGRELFYAKSHINLLFFPAIKEGKTILTKMDEKGFLIRIWDYNDREWCRVSIGTQDEMKQFVKAFDEVIA